jgi:hypothetical protein
LSASAHTPGPWQCYADLPSVEPNWHIVTNASRMRVLANVHIEPANETDKANARLITASPDMKAQLEATLNTLGLMADAYTLGSATRNTLEDECKAIRGVLAKAAGRA